jgi:NitT/TauT family transport system permease protein
MTTPKDRQGERSQPGIQPSQALTGTSIARGWLLARAAESWSSLRRALEASSLIVLLIVLWQIAVSVFHPPAFLLPAPGDVWAAIWNGALRWPPNIWITLQESIGGFGLAVGLGLALGLMIAWSDILSRTVLPFLVVFNVLPKVAIAPLFIIYLGYGVFPNMVTAATIAFFPMVINTSIGLMQTDEELIDLARSLNAPKWKIFVRLRLPNATPYILSALKVSTTMAVTGAMVGEFVASQGGLGNLLIATQVTLQMDIAYASLFWLVVIGLALYYIVDFAGRLIFPWAHGPSVET